MRSWFPVPPKISANASVRAALRRLAWLTPALLLLAVSSSPANAQSDRIDRIDHYGQPIYASGVNVAYIFFEADVGVSFCEPNAYPCGTSQFTFEPSDGSPSIQTQFGIMLDKVKAAGGNTVRWWLHTGGNYSPRFDQATGRVIGISPEALRDVVTALDMAQARDMYVIATLFSSQLVNLPTDHYGPSEELAIQPKTADAGRLLLIDQRYLQSYIDNALIPLVTHVGNHPALLGWDLMNEPEGTTQIGFIKDKKRRLPAVRFDAGGAEQLFRLDNPKLNWIEVNATGEDVAGGITFPVGSLSEEAPNPMHYIQRYVNRAAKVIHENVPGVKVTVTSHHADRISDVNQSLDPFIENYYADAKLAAAGGEIGSRPQGVLDFVMVNYYAQWHGKNESPFHNPAAHWGFGKPIVVGEFVALDLDPFIASTNTFVCGDTVAKEALIPQLHASGYAGGLVWSYTTGWEISNQGVQCHAPQALTCVTADGCSCVDVYDQSPACDGSGAFAETFACVQNSTGGACWPCLCESAFENQTVAPTLVQGAHRSDVAIASVEAEDSALSNVVVQCPQQNRLFRGCSEPNTAGGAFIRMWPNFARTFAFSFDTSDFPLGASERPVVPDSGAQVLDFVLRFRYRVPSTVAKTITFEVDGQIYPSYNIFFEAASDWAILEVPAVLTPDSTVVVRVSNPPNTTGLDGGSYKLDVDRMTVTRVPATSP